MSPVRWRAGVCKGLPDSRFGVRPLGRQDKGYSTEVRYTGSYTATSLDSRLMRRMPLVAWYRIGEKTLISKLRRVKKKWLIMEDGQAKS